MRWSRRIRQFFRREPIEASMDAEMRHHIDCEIAERIRRGMTRDDATRAALRDFGGVERHKEDARDVRGLRVLDDAMRDAAYAARVLRRNPGFTIAVALTFALGIGCTTSIFSLVHGILLQPLPYARPAELVTLWERNVARGVERNVVSAANFDAWRQRARSFTDMAAMVPAPRTIAGEPAERISAAQVSPSFFRVLGTKPAMGRDFTANDEVNGGAPVVILSDAMWRSRFGADPRAVGRTMVMDGESYTIIGVMPAGFEPPRFGWVTEHPLWIPFGVTAGNQSWGRFLHLIARRAPGVTLEQSRADMARVGEQLSRESENNKVWSTSVVPLAEQITGDVRKPLLVVFAAVTLLLLMATVNVGGLVTSFVQRRDHELAVRRAIGASSTRLIRQQLVQSAVLGLLGAVVGLAFAMLGTKALIALMPPDVPRVAEVRVDATVLAFALFIAFATTLVFGIAASIRGTRSGIAASPTRVSPRLGGSRIVTVEIAIGLVLSVLAALMVRSLGNLRSVDLGFHAGSVVTGRVSLSSDRYPTAAQQRAFFDAVLLKARAIPGVTSASIATTRPFACCAPTTFVRDFLGSDESVAGAPTTDVRFVDESYFAALRVPVLAGATFTAAESRDGAPRAVISRSLATALWGPANPIGRSVTTKLFGTTTAEVIGVVGDLHLADPRTPPRPAMFLSTARFPSSERDVIVSGSGDSAALLAALREVVASTDKLVPLYRATALESAVGVLLAQDRFTTLLLSAFALLALLLAAVGVYGVLSGDVARRRKELGIRIALGAQRRAVLALVLRRALAPTVTGVTIGVVVSLALSRSMSAMVFGVGTSDPTSLVVVVAVLAAVAGLATLVPALRASRVDPTEVIKQG